MNPEEERLRTSFRELRQRDQRGAPDFRKMWAAPRPLRSPWRLVVPAASLAAAAMVLLWCGAQSMLSGSSAPQSAAPTAASSAGDEVAFDPAPLDFLLDVPGSAPRAALTSFDSNPLQGW